MEIDLPDVQIDNPEGFFLRFFTDLSQLTGLPLPDILHDPDSGQTVVRYLTGDTAFKPVETAFLENFRTLLANKLQAAVDGGSGAMDSRRPGSPPMLQASPYMASQEPFFKRCAAAGVTVLLHGPTGAGKTFAARLIHALSGRKGALQEIHLGAIPESLLEIELFGASKGSFTDSTTDRTGRLALAQGGTVLFEGLDAVSDQARAKILEFLKDKTFYPVGSASPVKLECQIICTSTCPPEGLDRSFYYGFSPVALGVRPLADRPEDWRFFFALALSSASASWDGASFEGFIADRVGYAWPGNCTEFIAVVRNWSLLDGSAARDHEPPGLKKMIDDYKRKVVCDILRQNKGNQTRSAKVLGIQRTYLAKLIHDYQIQQSEVAGEPDGSSGKAVIQGQDH